MHSESSPFWFKMLQEIKLDLTSSTYIQLFHISDHALFQESQDRGRRGRARSGPAPSKSRECRHGRHLRARSGQAPGNSQERGEAQESRPDVRSGWSIRGNAISPSSSERSSLQESCRETRDPASKRTSQARRGIRSGRFCATTSSASLLESGCWHQRPRKHKATRAPQGSTKNRKSGRLQVQQATVGVSSSSARPISTRETSNDWVGRGEMQAGL